MSRSLHFPTSGLVGQGILRHSAELILYIYTTLFTIEAAKKTLNNYREEQKEKQTNESSWNKSSKLDVFCGSLKLL